MNNIYNKLRSKRRYIRKPTCLNRLGICTFEKCRCFIAIKAPKITSKGVKINHRLQTKVEDRLKEKAKQENDRENEMFFATQYNSGCGVKGCSICDNTVIKIIGEHSKHRFICKRYEKMIWLVLGLLCLVALLIK